VIVCGWCGKATIPAGRCMTCGHADPSLPYEQRGQIVPSVAVAHDPGRPTLDPAEIRHRLAEARTSLGGHPTVEALAGELDVSPRTVRRWQKVAG
jgi:hypothetical protein